eukprot:TRINITY_DN33350_c0_g1_i1.p1 TRINITY_DN33350_c0_g1~~TRINITY_DN33350_c0_g1_i1.p1  ORF type:complete len:388 (+),score=113.74 TRINITY_DN33350_c0_g1_i1:288-1451(+)
MQPVTVLELCAATVLNREPGRHGHMLLLGKEDTNHALRGTIERGLRARWLPHLNITPAMEVQQLAAWLYSTDLGQTERKEDDSCDSDEDMDTHTPVSYQSSPARDMISHGSRLHPRRRVGFLHGLHRATPDVQACLVGALQHSTVYGAGERKLKLLTVVATCDTECLSQLSHRLRERFAIAARVTDPHLPDRLPPSVHELLAQDPGVTPRKIFGDHELVPPSGVYLSTQVARYLNQCVRRCRVHPDTTLQHPTHGVHTELAQTAKVFAVVSRGRQFVTPEDVRTLLPYMLFHRVMVAPSVSLAAAVDEGGGGRQGVDEAGDEVLMLLPKVAQRWADSCWAVPANEDLLHSVVASVCDAAPAAQYNAVLADSTWAHITAVVGRVPVPL